ncbi:MAG: Na/Pi symporter, partial [Thermaerobacterales bacterium]
ALPLLAAGAPIFIIWGRRSPAAILPIGFGILLLGLGTIGSATAPLAQDPAIPRMVSAIGDRPLLGVGAGFILTTVLDSSSAAIALLQQFIESGLLTPGNALPILYGDNLGTTTATLVAALALSSPGRQAAAFHLLFNLVGVVMLWPLTWVLPDWLPLWSGSGAQQLAMAHTVFNVSAAAMCLPWRHHLIRICQNIFP